ncbi:MAG: tRNA 2-thiouridine(34) synthase MnmA [Actinobacteria bacterium]|nr:tRNA 2-thiouridine(34) synthase MnmA [Actinomycetota bacterium]
MLRLFEPTFQPWNPKKDPKQIAVLTSGGVDSTVTALLLKEAGWQVLAITMKLPTAGQCNHPSPCCGSDAGLVCQQMGIPHYFLDTQESFEQLIIKPFRQAYAQGRTPSPCADCNTFLKFGLVWDFLEKTFGIRYLATGHYARIVCESDRFYLTRAADSQRDQSYFLYGIPRRRLQHLVFPLAQLTKQKVRELARSNDLQIAEKPDSMELCFAGEGDYRLALDRDTSPSPGPILDTQGKVLGQHQGIVNYTLGQRRGLGIAAGEPRYVVRICPEDDSVTLGTREQACRRDVRVTDVNALIPDKLQPGKQLLGQIRSPGQASACTVVEVGPQAMLVEFTEPQFGPCSGQRLVLYDDRGFVVAGGTINFKR